MTLLSRQSQGQQVEILVNISPRGKVSIGHKRNRLIEEARGEYVAFIDDDDIVSNDYIKLVIAAAKEGRDCIGIVGVLRRNGFPDWTFRHSITVGRWCKDKHTRIYFRTPNHLNPIKLSIAKQVKFPESNFGEDKSYSDLVRPMLKTETFIEKVIYIYLK